VSPAELCTNHGWFIADLVVPWCSEVKIELNAGLASLISTALVYQGDIGLADIGQHRPPPTSRMNSASRGGPARLRLACTQSSYSWIRAVDGLTDCHSNLACSEAQAGPEVMVPKLITVMNQKRPKDSLRDTLGAVRT